MRFDRQKLNRIGNRDFLRISSRIGDGDYGGFSRFEPEFPERAKQVVVFRNLLLIDDNCFDPIRMMDRDRCVGGTPNIGAMRNTDFPGS